jgi:NAD(P)-dependent dehydrogenase (short-subunit alcohol dehydrogenase family)
MKPLEGKVAVVAGATRGAGRGIACALGEAGATVYCTGRSTRDKRVARRQSKRSSERRSGKFSAFELERRPETIEETAELVSSRGGTGIYACVDHTDEEQVKSLFKRVKREQGRLDILINDIWGGDELTEWKPFWTLSLEKGLLMLRRAVFSHIITSRHAAPLMVELKRGLIIEITDGDGLYYRGTLFYDLVKMSVIRLAFDMSEELRRHKVAALALTPGYLRSEAMLEHMNVTEENWREGAKGNPSFIESETPLFVGRAVAALAADKKILKKSGKVLSSWNLAREYGFTDADGRVPRINEWVQENMPDFLKKVRDAERRFCEMGSIFATP